MESINANVQQETIKGREVMTIILHIDDQIYDSPKPWELKRLESFRYGIEGDHFMIHYVNSKVLNITSISSIKEQVKGMKHGMVNQVKIKPKSVDISKLIG